MIKQKVKYALFCLFCFTLTATLAFLISSNLKKTNAANVWDFKAGNIMSDAVMRDYTSMSQADIETFLRAKSNCYDTDLSKVSPTVDYFSQSWPYTWHIRDGHFVCMVDESFNGKSASQIIYEVSQRHHINPKVLIVLLQKEQGLVTDSFPNSVQYRSATGYGCSDSKPCEAEYYGFENQLNKAAELFDEVLSGGWSNYVVGWNYVHYYKDDYYKDGTYCGGSNVYIENLATAALYRYTPYQPNYDSLAVGYGSGAVCGAYGNRNFFLYYTDWFGSTQASRWMPMLDARYMVVENPTVKVYPDTSSLDGEWLTPGDRIKFNSKTTVYVNGEAIACLRSVEDTAKGISRCVLMPRLKEFIPEFTPIDEQDVYVAANYTCKLDLRRGNLVPSACYSNHEVLNIAATYNLDGIDYYITKDNYGTSNYYAVVAARTKPLVVNAMDRQNIYITANYTCKIDLKTGKLAAGAKCYTNHDILPVAATYTVADTNYYALEEDYGKNYYALLVARAKPIVISALDETTRLRVVSNTAKYLPGTNTKVQNIDGGVIIEFASKIVTSDGKVYYRTLSDTRNNKPQAISAEDLSEDLFADFVLPRNLVANRDTNAVDFIGSETCESIEKGNISYYVSKIFSGTEWFYRTQASKDSGSNCVVPASALSEVR